MIELRRGGVSYFIDTLEALRDELGPDAEITFLIGADQALVFHQWRDWERILVLATPAVLLRPPWDEESFAKALDEAFNADEADSWRERVIPAPLHDVSATSIRRRARTGEPVAGDLDPAVAAYIREHRLYRAAPR